MAGNARGAAEARGDSEEGSAKIRFCRFASIYGVRPLAAVRTARLRICSKKTLTKLSDQHPNEARRRALAMNHDSSSRTDPPKPKSNLKQTDRRQRRLHIHDSQQNTLCQE